ncbi:hypothetical protein SEA_CASSITA_113 [Microbacterium phage Cassita]|nr:hypothetical protein SEA_CASSITA_113 [Microbacterium phage Cassita]
MTDREIVTLLKKAQSGLETHEHRGKWLMIEQVIGQLVSKNLKDNLPITAWAYDTELGRISPTYHRLRDLKEENA